jgi:hypothetical protein
MKTEHIMHVYIASDVTYCQHLTVEKYVFLFMGGLVFILYPMKLPPFSRANKKETKTKPALIFPRVFRHVLTCVLKTNRNWRRYWKQAAMLAFIMLQPNLFNVDLQKKPKTM